MRSTAFAVCAAPLQKCRGIPRHFLRRISQNFVEDNTLFKEAVAAIKNYTGMTDEDVEAILSKCIYEPF